MNRLSATRMPIPSVHESSTPWLARLGSAEVMHIDGMAAQRWLCVQRGSLWVTAARGTAGPVAPEADIWLSAGDSLELPPGTAWLLQAWPTAELVLLERASPQLHTARLARGSQRLLSRLRDGVQRVMRLWGAGVQHHNATCAQRA